MAITAIHKGFVFALLLAGVFSQRDPKQTRGDDASKLGRDEASILEQRRLMDEKLVREQAESAVYSFAASVVDDIMGGTQSRQESRNGLNLTGSYAYSDGFFWREVKYVADEHGYRVISEVVEPLGNGPVINPEGGANVRASIAGQDYQYSITGDDLAKKPTIPKHHDLA